MSHAHKINAAPTYPARRPRSTPFRDVQLAPAIAGRTKRIGKTVSHPELRPAHIVASMLYVGAGIGAAVSLFFKLQTAFGDPLVALVAVLIGALSLVPAARFGKGAR